MGRGREGAGQACRFTPSSCVRERVWEEEGGSGGGGGKEDNHGVPLEAVFSCVLPFTQPQHRHSSLQPALLPTPVRFHDPPSLALSWLLDMKGSFLVLKNQLHTPTTPTHVQDHVGEVAAGVDAVALHHLGAADKALQHLRGWGSGWVGQGAWLEVGLGAGCSTCGVGGRVGVHQAGCVGGPTQRKHVNRAPSCIVLVAATKDAPRGLPRALPAAQGGCGCGVCCACCRGSTLVLVSMLVPGCMAT